MEADNQALLTREGSTESVLPIVIGNSAELLLRLEAKSVEVSVLKADKIQPRQILVVEVRAERHSHLVATSHRSPILLEVSHTLLRGGEGDVAVEGVDVDGIHVSKPFLGVLVLSLSTY